MHGDESGSVDREHNLPGSRLIEADPKRVLAERQRMDQPPYGMDRSRGWVTPLEKRWARHGSTRWLWKVQSVSAAIRYVVDQHGDPMAVFEAIEP